MQIKLKGLNYTTKTLKTGKIVKYWYAWRGGPRLEGQPGSVEFMNSYNDAVRQKVEPSVHTLAYVLDAFEDSAEFGELSARTQRDYKKHLRSISVHFGDFPISALADRRSRAEFLNWRDDLAASSKRGADYKITVFARSLSWAVDRGLISSNPLRRPGRLYKSSRREIVWSTQDEAEFLCKMPAHLHLPFVLGLWLGQRQGDVLKLTWSDYDGHRIRLQQNKTGARLQIPVGAPLKAALDAEQSRREALLNLDPSLNLAPTLCMNLRHQSWTGDGFRASLGKALKSSGLHLPQFMDLRGTFVTRLALAGCSVPEIAAVTGHSLKNVHAILDAHYLNRDQRLADKAIQALQNQLASSN